MSARALALLLVFALRAAGADPVLPDPKLTPGVARTDLSPQTICATKWGKDARHVTLSMKKAVFAEYHIPYANHSLYEVDHLISRELGGADDVSNLWPEPWKGTWNAHMKDRLENRMHVLVCSGKVTLQQAQFQMAHDWVALYRATFPQGGVRAAAGAPR